MGERSHPSAPTPSPWSPAHGAPAALQPVDGVRLQGGQDGAQGGEVPQFPAALGGRGGWGAGHTSHLPDPQV